MPDNSHTLDTTIHALSGTLIPSDALTAAITPIPNTEAIAAWLMPLKQLIFSDHLPQAMPPSEQLNQVARSLHQQIAIALRTNADQAEELTIRFLEQLPEVRALLHTDLEAFYEGDPAATSLTEIVLAYPGLQAILVYRLAHVLWLQGVPLIPRIMTEYAHSQTGIDIHPGATIGHHFFIDHGTGIVIGETTVIGDHVKLYQGVTLGALSTRGGQSLRGKRRHPTIEDRVTIYAGASVLGGETVIGHDAVIGGNAFITASVAPGMRVSVKQQELDMRPSKSAW